MKTEHNITRLRHLLSLYRLDQSEFLDMISKNLKKPITEEDIFGKKIDLNHLKRIDKIFKKGLHYYLDPSAPVTSREASIFFRKQTFQNDKLNLGAIRRVREFEQIKLLLSGWGEIAGKDFPRKLETYTTSNNPRDVAAEIRKILSPTFSKNRRTFLKNMIEAFAKQNILVFEFVEAWNQTEKANIDGFFLQPNMIVLKRHSGFTREIFTLAHELGHYLLNKEEIDTINYDFLEKHDLSKTERWCNDFAFDFLAGEHASEIESFSPASAANDYHHKEIRQIADRTHLSRLAVFTRLLLQKRISPSDYNLVRQGFEEEYQRKKKEKEEERRRKKELGLTTEGGSPRPIRSPLFVSAIRSAYYEGILDEYEAGQMLRVKSKNLNKYL